MMKGHQEWNIYLEDEAGEEEIRGNWGRKERGKKRGNWWDKDEQRK